VIDEALDALDDDAHKRVMALFNDALADAAIINIGRPEGRDRFFTRVLHLIKDPKGRMFKSRRHVSAGPTAGALATRRANPVA
jgi:putative ATP-binding cassette transporter